MRRLRGLRVCLVGLCCGLALACAAALPATSAAAGAKLAGCPLFPAPPAGISPKAPSLPTLAAWNQGISKAPLHPRSRQIIRRINTTGGDHLHPDFGSNPAYGIPYRVVAASQARVPIRYTAYGGESDPGPFPIPFGTPVEGGRRSNGDRHVLILQRGRCLLFELYRAFPLMPGPGGAPAWHADSGARWSLRSAATRPDGWTSADAAGLPILPGLVRYQEVKRGHINHAIRVTFSQTRNAWIRPATHCAGSTRSALAPAMGLRLRMRRNFPISHLRGAAKVIVRAMKRYGLIVADNGSNWFFQGASSRRWKDEELDQLKSIPGTAFEVVKSAAKPKLC